MAVVGVEPTTDGAYETPALPTALHSLNLLLNYLHMKPPQVSDTLRRIASAIENSKNPDRNLVANDLKLLINRMAATAIEDIKRAGVRVEVSFTLSSKKLAELVEKRGENDAVIKWAALNAVDPFAPTIAKLLHLSGKVGFSVGSMEKAPDGTPGWHFSMSNPTGMMQDEMDEESIKFFGINDPVKFIKSSDAGTQKKKIQDGLLSKLEATFKDFKPGEIEDYKWVKDAKINDWQFTDAKAYVEFHELPGGDRIKI